MEKKISYHRTVNILIKGPAMKQVERKAILTTPNCSDALAFQSRRLVSSLPEMT